VDTGLKTVLPPLGHLLFFVSVSFYSHSLHTHVQMEAQRRELAAKPAMFYGKLGDTITDNGTSQIGSNYLDYGTLSPNALLIIALSSTSGSSPGRQVI